VENLGTAAMLKNNVLANQPIILLSTPEESRALRLINSAMSYKAIRLSKQLNDSEVKYTFLTWDIHRKTTEHSFLGKQTKQIAVDDGIGRPSDAIDKYILKAHKPTVLVIPDAHFLLNEDPVFRRALKNAFTVISKGGMERKNKTIILVTHEETAPADLTKYVHVIKMQYPSRNLLTNILNTSIIRNKEILEEQINSMSENERSAWADRLVDALTGLTEVEAENTIARTITRLGKLDIAAFVAEKKSIIVNSGVLDFQDTSGMSMSQVGGLGELKEWLVQRRAILSPEAAEYGIPAPKGVLLLGPPGTGKSYISKVIAAAWGMPLLQLSMDKIYGSLVGQSESNMRRALDTAEAVAPCVLQLDEIEKAVGGGDRDGGTSSRVLGKFLTWMQERKEPVFVVATANDISALPPEMLRKGRFDEIFFVDIPVNQERKDILAIHFKKRNHEVNQELIDVLADKTDGFVGAELEQVVVETLIKSYTSTVMKGSVFSIVADEAVKSATEVVPLSHTMEKKIKAVRKWALSRARFASKAQRQKLEKETGGTVTAPDFFTNDISELE